MDSIPESHRDLLNAQVATLATVGPDGRSQLSEVWFLADGEDVRLSLNTARQKVKNLQRNPVCTLFILGAANPYRYLEPRADAELAPDPDYAFAELGAPGSVLAQDITGCTQPYTMRTFQRSSRVRRSRLLACTRRSGGEATQREATDGQVTGPSLAPTVVGYCGDE